MKNIIINLRVFLTFSCFILSLNTNAQVFDPSTIWYTCGRDITSNIPFGCSTNKLENSHFEGDTLVSIFRTYPKDWIVKQKDGKVYVNDDLIYNFNLIINNTI
jgi:hypothetical protein